MTTPFLFDLPNSASETVIQHVVAQYLHHEAPTRTTAQIRTDLEPKLQSFLRELRVTVYADAGRIRVEVTGRSIDSDQYIDVGVEHRRGSGRTFDVERVELQLLSAFRIASGALSDSEALEAELHRAIRSTGIRRYTLELENPTEVGVRTFYEARITLHVDLELGIDEPASLRLTPFPEDLERPTPQQIIDAQREIAIDEPCSPTIVIERGERVDSSIIAKLGKPRNSDQEERILSKTDTELKELANFQRMIEGLNYTPTFGAAEVEKCLSNFRDHLKNNPDVLMDEYAHGAPGGQDWEVKYEAELDINDSEDEDTLDVGEDEHEHVAEEETGPTPYIKLASTMHADPEYAWSWHCQYASTLRRSMGHEQANRLAVTIMINMWGIDTSRDARYRNFERQWAQLGEQQ